MFQEAKGAFKVSSGAGSIEEALAQWRAQRSAWLFACCTGGGALVSTPDGISCSLREGNVLAAESDFPGECRPLP
ncbi:MAG: hypothetical protein ACI4NA_02120, partial [Succinivibrio sp.]